MGIAGRAVGRVLAFASMLLLADFVAGAHAAAQPAGPAVEERTDSYDVRIEVRRTGPSTSGR